MAGELFAVVMAGGGGTRLWPASRRQRPKQSLRLLGDRSLFQLAVDRLRPLLPLERILVVTGADQVELLRRQAPELPEQCFVVEPEPRGTAAVAGLASLIVERRLPGAVMACVTADHAIADPESFREALVAAHALALEGDLVTLGITPAYPATGYGYVERGEVRGVFNGVQAYRVKAFKEKPTSELAKAYVSDGKHFWNSGMFVWRGDCLRKEIARQMPDLEAGLLQVEATLGAPGNAEAFAQAWAKLPRQTIDYGIMEHAERVSVIPADDLGWTDIGSWDRLLEVLPSDKDGNLALGEGTPLLVDSHGTLVYGEEARRLIVTLGVQDLIVVDTGDALLVCPRDRAEEIRSIVERLRSEGRGEHT
jgi:mannose-1-phosphate guanylyltransferase